VVECLYCSTNIIWQVPAWLTNILDYEAEHILISRSQWPCGLRCRSTATRPLRSWVQIPPGAWMFVVSVVCCQVEVSATSWSLVQKSPTDCGASLCVTKKLREWGCESPLQGCEKYNHRVVTPRKQTYTDQISYRQFFVLWLPAITECALVSCFHFVVKGRSFLNCLSPRHWFPLEHITVKLL